MDVLSLSPLQVGALHWMPRQGSHAMTVVCKGTFDLVQGTSRLSEVQDFPNDEDNHWNDDPSCSVYAPSDMAPFKRRADVVLVGDAYAPGGEPVSSLVVRVVVGSVDKAIEVCQDRHFDHQSELQYGERFARMAMRYERSGGGPHTSNPVGLSPETDRDSYGRLHLPNLQTVGTSVTGPHDYIEPVGYGPIAATWDGRRKLLGRHAPTWSIQRWNTQPLPQDIDGGYFSCAPPDQRLDKLSDTERIVLEHLHPQHPRLVCHLPGQRPRAFVERGGAARDLEMRPDTLWIDTTRLICTVTWRAHLEVKSPRERGRVVVGLEEGDKRLTWADISKMDKDNGIADEGTNDAVAVPAKELPFSKIDDEHTAVGSLNVPHEALPDFLKAGTGPKRRRSAQSMPAIKPVRDPTTMMPVVSAQDRSPSWLGAQQKAATPGPGPARTSNPPPSMDAAASYAPSPTASPWAKGGESAPPPANAAAMSAVPMPAAPIMPKPASPPVSPPAPHAPPPAPPAIRAPNPADALTKSPVVKEVEEPKPAANIERLVRPAPQEIVELLWFDETLMDAIAEQGAFKDLLEELHDGDEAFDPIDFDDEPPPEEPIEVRHRRDIVAIMTRGRVTSSASLNATMLDAVDESGSFEPPIVLMSGRLHLPFDELETLKATLAAVTPLIAGNKELGDTVATVQELMNTPWLEEGSGEVAQKLTDKIRAVFKKGDRMLDPAYLDNHTERILLEQRRYQTRTVLGDEWIRALMAPSASKEKIPTYIPLALAKDLPMFKTFDARVLGEAHVQQDQYEQHVASVKVRALGRVVTLTKASGIY